MIPLDVSRVSAKDFLIVFKIGTWFQAEKADPMQGYVMLIRLAGVKRWNPSISDC